MNDPDHERVSELFLQVCDLGPDESRAVLDEACAGDPELRRKVESLLAHDDDDVPEILDSGVLPAEVQPEVDPTRIGRYRILEKVGEGGMGVVYRAEQQDPIRRDVALKLIKLGIETRPVIARFESERQVLAMMNHPNIAQVLDAGATRRGRPYFVMEYVEGEPITTFCDDRRLSVPDRLQLFLQVCDGVQHAHQKAVIHRDIKPSNLLVREVDGKPIPKIIDFGIAKALDRRDAPGTEFGQLVGTPGYMSPEQAGQDRSGVDTRTDVYSLGAVLYELLVGVGPFESTECQEGGLDRAKQQIREREPQRPSSRVGVTESAATRATRRSTDPRSLDRQLRGDLDWIVMKALEKDPARRYSSPTELSADIRRHLDDEPVLAGPPSRVYRARKFVLRHKAGVGFAATLMLLLLGFAGTMTVQRAEVARERDRASEQAEIAEEILQFMIGLFRVSDPRRARGDDLTAREILDVALKRIDEELDDQPVVRARLQAAIGKIYDNLGMRNEGLVLMERADAELRLLLGDSHPDTLLNARSLAFAYFYAGRLDEAEALNRRTLAEQRRVFGSEHRETLNSQRNLANVCAAGRRYGEAEQLHLDALEIATRVHGEQHYVSLTIMSDLGKLYGLSGRFEESAEWTTRALEGLRVTDGDDHPRTLSAMNGLATAYMNLGKVERAEELFLEALESKRRVLGPAHPSTLKTIYNLACLTARSGKTDRAITLLEEAVALGYTNSRMENDSDLASLRGHPAFESVVARAR